MYPNTRKRPRHVLVIGDLLVDHDIFVTQVEPERDSGAMEPGFNVVRRQDSAGGAANSARILSVVNSGNTYLWGIIGSTHWGTFREVLEKSHAIDGASHMTELRGVRDETDPPMNTVTRILTVNEDQPQVVQSRFCRFSDVDHLHIPDVKRFTLLDQLHHIHEHESPLHAIVINDFNRGALTKGLIDKIAEYATSNRIPIFVDPHHDRARYADIRAAAVLPNLSEWCELVDDDLGPDYWRKNLHNPDILREMAIRSFRHLGNFDHHVIKCDRDGAVLFFPDAEKRHLCAIYHVEPTPVVDPERPLQMGCGDVMTAIFALEFPKENPTTIGALEAFQRANAAVACYREMPWHQMPPDRNVEQKQRGYPWTHRSPDADISKGALFLPQIHVIDMQKRETGIQGFFSQDTLLKNTLKEFVDDITNGWIPGSMKSLVLGAPPGTGKTTIRKALSGGISPLHEIGIINKTITEVEESPLDKFPPGEFRERFQTMRKENKEKHLFIVVDEALKEPMRTFLLKNGPTLLDAAHAEGLRFLLISAEFTPELENASEWRELMGRSKTYYPSGLDARPLDIPLIIAARFFEKRANLTRLIVDGAFLLAVTDLTLKQPEPRVVCAIVDEVLQTSSVDGEELKVDFTDLPDRHVKKVRQPKQNLGLYEFRR